MHTHTHTATGVGDNMGEIRCLAEVWTLQVLFKVHMHSLVIFMPPSSIYNVNSDLKNKEKKH